MKLLCLLLLIYTGVREATIYRDFKVSFHNQNNDYLSGNNNDGFYNRRAIKINDAPRSRVVKIILSANTKPKAYSSKEKPLHEDVIPTDDLKSLYNLNPVAKAIRRRGSNVNNNKHHKTTYRYRNRLQEQHWPTTSDTTQNINYINMTLVRYESSEISALSSVELYDWKDVYQEIWTKKLSEAANSTIPRGDQVNMVAARPVGKPCGDPNQHEDPWGTCILTVECDAEYRIYRGDHFCGRTQYVCCALRPNYDGLNPAFDISLASSSFATDSAEEAKIALAAKLNEERLAIKTMIQKGKRSDRIRKRRRKKKRMRKIRLRKKIRQIIHDIKVVLFKMYRNSSHLRKERTKQLKKYIEGLKKQFKKDQKTVKGIHNANIYHIDQKLATKLEEIRIVNQKFLMNSTFREVLLNGTLTKVGTHMLVEAYPELTPYLPKMWLRRDGGGEVDREVEGETEDDYLEHDIDYGAAFY